VGAPYYLRYTDIEPLVVEQNWDDFKTTMICAGHIVVPCNTLAQSPTFFNAVEVNMESGFQQLGWPLLLGNTQLPCRNGRV